MPNGAKVTLRGEKMYDFLTIIRNASRASKKQCGAQWSRVRESIAKILKDEGFINDFEVIEEKNGHKNISISLKYVNKEPAIVGIDRMSTPGCRQYYKYRDIPRVLRGLGISILSTSRGVLKDKDARRQKAGGELLCAVW